jgi:quercetin dioxygenase-like cupin family protein
MATKALEERDLAHTGSPKPSTFRADAIKASAEFRRAYEKMPNVVAVDQMPFERSPDGLIKHLLNADMNTREKCVEGYMQFLPQNGRSGKHRHMWEELIFVLEGSGYDLHWDLNFDCVDKFEWEWQPEPRKFEWSRGDFIYVPPFSIHQHFNAHAGETRLIVMSNRIVKEMGFDWLDQLENAPGF